LYVSRAWLAAFLTSVFVAQGMSDLAATATGSQWAALLSAFGTVGVFLGGWLSDHLGRMRAAWLMTLLSGGISLVFGFMGGGAWALLAMVGCVYLLLIAADSAIYSTAITELAPLERLGSAQAAQAFFGFGATILSPIVAGRVLDWGWGWGATFALAGVVGIALGLPLIIKTRE
jgi:MFS family permease